MNAPPLGRTSDTVPVLLISLLLNYANPPSSVSLSIGNLSSLYFPPIMPGAFLLCSLLLPSPLVRLCLRPCPSPLGIDTTTLCIAAIHSDVLLFYLSNSQNIHPWIGFFIVAYFCFGSLMCVYEYIYIYIFLFFYFYELLYP